MSKLIFWQKQRNPKKNDLNFLKLYIGRISTNFDFLNPTKAKVVVLISYSSFLTQKDMSATFLRIEKKLIFGN